MFLGPIRCLNGRTTAGHTASGNQKVGLDYYSLEIRHFSIISLGFQSNRQK
jgi:hypothetical protein